MRADDSFDGIAAPNSGARGSCQDIAVIGSGIAGLSCAWLLSRSHRVTVFEAEERIGGHSHTVEVEVPEGGIAVDTGFIVYNETTYPNLTALFAHLSVPTEVSDMSFSASLDGGALEYAGTSLRGLFGQTSNLFRPRFWSMLRDLRRLYREAPGHEVTREPDLTSLGDWLDAHGYGEAIQQDHILPMAAAIWSSRAGAVRDYPAAAFFRFCDTHGLLRLANRPQWRTVSGGSQEYVARLLGDYRGSVRTNSAVTAIARDPEGVILRTARGDVSRFDHVVIATHADQALAMLDDADPTEQALLGAFGRSRNVAVLHTDKTLMPKRRSVWASWNYLGDRRRDEPPCVTYWMNNLQTLPTSEQLFVTLNPPRPPAPGTVLHTQTYEHPLFDVAAMRAQRRLWSMQGARRSWFCGAWFGAGFHEDGLQAGLAVAEALGGKRRPWRVDDESGRIHLGAAPAALEAASV